MFDHQSRVVFRCLWMQLQLQQRILQESVPSNGFNFPLSFAGLSPSQHFEPLIAAIATFRGAPRVRGSPFVLHKLLQITRFGRSDGVATPYRYEPGCTGPVRPLPKPHHVLVSNKRHQTPTRKWGPTSRSMSWRCCVGVEAACVSDATCLDPFPFLYPIVSSIHQ